MGAIGVFSPNGLNENTVRCGGKARANCGIR